MLVLSETVDITGVIVTDGVRQGLPSTRLKIPVSLVRFRLEAPLSKL